MASKRLAQSGKNAEPCVSTAAVVLPEKSPRGGGSGTQAYLQMGRPPRNLHGNAGAPSVLGARSVRKETRVAVRQADKVNHALRGPLLQKRLRRRLRERNNIVPQKRAVTKRIDNRSFMSNKVVVFLLFGPHHPKELCALKQDQRNRCEVVLTKERTRSKFSKVKPSPVLHFIHPPRFLVLATPLPKKPV